MDHSSVESKDVSSKRPVGRPRSDKQRQICASPGSEVKLMPSTSKRALPNPFSFFMQSTNTKKIPQAIMVPVVPIPIPVFAPPLVRKSGKVRAQMKDPGNGRSKIKGTVPVTISNNIKIKTDSGTPPLPTHMLSMKRKVSQLENTSTSPSKSKKEPRPIPANKMCVAPGCTKYACFGFSGSKASFCKLHSSDKPGMIDVVSRRCESENCQKHPAFALPGERARFCKLHKSSEMIDVINRRCEHQHCNKHRVFAFPAERPRFCKLHSLPGMVDVKSRKCEYAGCLKHPAYAMKGRRPARCRIHVLPGMVNVTKLRNEEAKFKTLTITARDQSSPKTPIHKQISEILAFDRPLRVQSVSPLLCGKVLKTGTNLNIKSTSKSIFSSTPLQILVKEEEMAPFGNLPSDSDKAPPRSLVSDSDKTYPKEDDKGALNLLVQAMMSDPSFSS